MLLSSLLSLNKQNGKLSVSLCFTIQAQHFLWLGQAVFGHAHSVILEQLICKAPWYVNKFVRILY